MSRKVCMRKLECPLCQSHSQSGSGWVLNVLSVKALAWLGLECYICKSHSQSGWHMTAFSSTCWTVGTKATDGIQELLGWTMNHSTMTFNQTNNNSHYNKLVESCSSMTLTRNSVHSPSTCHSYIQVYM